jgi:hypothetical protein
MVACIEKSLVEEKLAIDTKANPMHFHCSTDLEDSKTTSSWMTEYPVKEICTKDNKDECSDEMGNRGEGE